MVAPPISTRNASASSPATHPTAAIETAEAALLKLAIAHLSGIPVAIELRHVAIATVLIAVARGRGGIR